MLDEHALELERADAIVRGFEDVIGAPDVSQVAVAVAQRHVTGAIDAARERQQVSIVALITLHKPERPRLEASTATLVHMTSLAGSATGVFIGSQLNDYAELIGCCDRVLMLYEGRIARELAGSALTEQTILNAAFNLRGTMEATH